MAAQRLESGSWFARWGEWQIVIRDEGGNWAVSVFRWPSKTSLKKRVLLSQTSGLRSSEVAIDWASSYIKSLGARVFISGKEQPLASFLTFFPAPEVLS